LRRITRSTVIGRIGITLGAGIAGGLVFWLLHLPAPWLSGGLVGVVGLLALRVRPVLPDSLRDLGMLMAGAVTGSAITPEMVQTVARYPVSMAILAITTIAIVVIGRFVLVRFFAWDRQSAMFAAMPGALSAVIATVAEAGGDMMRVMAVQSFRMFILLAVLPSTVMMAVREVAPPAVAVLPATGFAAMLLLALIIALVFERLRVMAPFLLGGMVAAGVLHVTGLLSGASPPIVANLAMLLVGIYAGSRMSGLDLVTVRSLVLPGLALFLVTTLIAAIGGLAVSWLVGLPIAETLVAFAPGGLEAMVMLGLAMGLDPLYVTSHHVARFVMIATALPLISKALNR
jgi:membrane AbrB-like protein